MAFRVQRGHGAHDRIVQLVALVVGDYLSADETASCCSAPTRLILTRYGRLDLFCLDAIDYTPIDLVELEPSLSMVTYRGVNGSDWAKLVTDLVRFVFLLACNNGEQLYQLR